MKKVFNVLLGVAGVFVILMIAGAAFLHFKYPGSIKMPSILEQAKILKGKEFLQKKCIFENIRLGKVSDIIRIESQDSNKAHIGVAGNKGALFLTRKYEVMDSISFPKPASHIDFIDLSQDGVFSFMNRGSWADDAAIISKDGDIIWEYGGSVGVNDMAKGNFDSDQEMEFVVGFNGGGGVHLVDDDGTQLWKERDGNVWHVEALDTNQDGVFEIIHSNAQGQLTIRDAEGKVIFQKQLEPYFSKFSLFKEKGTYYILTSGKNKIWLFDLKGNIVRQYNAPHSGDLGEVRGVLVKLGSESVQHFVFSISYDHWQRCNFYVYDKEGNLEYHEILTEQCGAIATLPGLNNNELLLLGGNSKVLQYSR